MIGAPPGLAVRPYAGPGDLPAIVEVVNAENEADGVAERDTVEGMAAWLGSPSPQYDPSRDVVVASLDGRIVAVAGQEWIDTRDGELREYRLWGAVHPDARRQGIGTALLEDNERRARVLAQAHPADRRPVFGSWAGLGRPGSVLLERSGYEIARWFFDMVRPDLADIPDDPPLPVGLELRPATAEQTVAIWRANREAFRDHWGGSDESEAAMRRYFGGPDVDLSLWLIVWDGDQIAGGILNMIHPDENEALGLRRGWLDSVFTRRTWRRRGVARALIVRSLRLLRERGMTSAALGVDADNANGALGLYESAGFAVDDRFAAWRKPMNLHP